MAENKKRILVVEDETPLQQALYDGMTRAGFDVLLAKNGQEGLNTAISEHPDIILADIMMPVMDGITMLRGIRGDAWGQHVKVIMLTNLNENKEIAESKELGSHHFLVKANWKMADLVNEVSSRLAV